MNTKKRKVDYEQRSFQESWTVDFFFVQHFGKCVCLICQDTVVVYKVSNVKRHYETLHEKDYHNFVGKTRVEEAERPKKELKKQSSFFTT